MPTLAGPRVLLCRRGGAGSNLSTPSVICITVRIKPCGGPAFFLNRWRMTSDEGPMLTSSRAEKTPGPCQGWGSSFVDHLGRTDDVDRVAAISMGRDKHR